MNNINKAMTASSILSSMKTPSVEKDASEQSTDINIQDSVDKSSDFKKEPSMFPLSERAKQTIQAGVLIGGTIGGIGGGVIAYGLADKKITNKDLNTVQVNWKEPVLEPQNLGQIPQDFYSTELTGTPTQMKDVIVNNPIMQDGKPLMTAHSATYTDYGVPKVSQKPAQIVHQNLSGYNETVTPVKVSLNNTTGQITADIVKPEAGGSGSLTTTEQLSGFKHEYTPNIVPTPIAYYDKPKVEFYTGVNAVTYTVAGSLLGIVSGSIVGGLAGLLIEKARLLQEEQGQAPK